MVPIIFVAVQLMFLAAAFVLGVRRNPAPAFKALYLAAFCGVIGMDIWYFAHFAYPDGFAF